MEPAHPFSDAGLQNAAQSSVHERSTSTSEGAEAMVILDEAEEVEGRGGGPATGTLDRLEAFTAGRSDALADML
jgi:hypothetical protein